MKAVRLLVASLLVLAATVVAKAEMGDMNSFETSSLTGAVTTLSPFVSSSPMDDEQAQAYYEKVVEIEGPGHLIEYETDPHTLPTPILLEAIDGLRGKYGEDLSNEEIINEVLIKKSNE